MGQSRNNPNLNTAWLNSLTPAQQAAVTNLCGNQLSGYNFVAYGAMGDQPGQHAWHYLAPWQTLPDGSFIALQKFIESPVQYYTITDPVDRQQVLQHLWFHQHAVPFPTESVSNYLYLPFIAFNYLGQLVTGRDEYIPLAHGSVLPAIDPNTKALQLGSRRHFGNAARQQHQHRLQHRPH